MNGLYTLVGQTPVPEPDPVIWATWFDCSDHQVDVTHVLDIAVVSTVFLGRHNFYPWGGEPLLFETMVFWKGEGPEEQDRCCTWRQAERMHAHWVREAASPHLYFAHLLRQAQKTWGQAWSELKEALVKP